jgi:hypothetical protein
MAPPSLPLDNRGSCGRCCISSVPTFAELGEARMDRNREQAIRERAYFIWEREGCPHGRADDHWRQAIVEWFGEECRRDAELMDDEEKVLAGRRDANIPALLTKDVHGG